MAQISRRRLLRYAGALTAAAVGPVLAGCADADLGAEGPAPADGQRFRGESITVLVYSGVHEELYRKHFVQQFQRATGARVVLESAWLEGIARLQAAAGSRPPYDLMQTDPIQGQPAYEAGLFQRFDRSAVPNATRFAPRLLDTHVWRDSWGLPFVSSAMTLVTNTGLRAQPYQTWAELLTSPPPRGVMFYQQSYMSLYTFAAIRAELDGAVGRAADMITQDLDGVLAFARANRGLVKYWWPSTTDAVNAVVQGDVGAGNIHGNGLLAPMRQGRKVTGVIPPGDVAYTQLFFAVPKGVRNPELCEAALDFIASEEFQRALAGSGEYPSAIPEVAREQAARDALWARAYPSTDDQFAKLAYYPYEPLLEHADKINRVWDREVVRGG
ncbi:MAG TPA: extracellular solute-binding protein [Micromonospora sp.]